jgi:crotonobetainyl-CoA:carnitine CoA-transferase CaiB-like acyl-CoA transferase
VCLARQPKLIYGRMTGWGQSGPLSQAAGHDLNYIALTGALNAIGRKGQLPAPPLNLLGDFAGGSAYLAFGLVCAFLEAQRSGRGQVVDAAIVDGTAHLMTSIYGMYAAGLMSPERGSNFTDSGAFFYDVYTCADDLLISIAPIEPKFYGELLKLLGIDASEMPPQNDRSEWEAGRAKLAKAFRTKTRAEWCALLEGTDVCFAPVLNFDEAAAHPHMRSRAVLVDIDGVVQPAPAPRFSRSIPGQPSPPRKAENTPLAEALAGWMTFEEIESLRATGLTIQA